MFDLRTLELFTRVAALGKIGAAGAEFGLAPATATLRVQMLEEELGVRLLNRNTRSVSLTSEGAIFLEHAKRVLSAVEDARETMAGAAKGAGVLRVTASATFARRYIVPHISRFLAAHPDIEIDMELSDATVNMVERGFDLAIRIGALADSRLVAAKLAGNRRLIVASPAYLKRTSIPLTAAELARHDCLVEGHRGHWRFRDGKGREETVRVNGRFRTNHGEAIAVAAATGGGLAMLSLWHAAEYIRRGELVPVLQELEPLPDWNIWAVRSDAASPPHKVTAFIDFLRSTLKETLPTLDDLIQA